MIHELRISNFFSIRDEATLDLRVPGKSPAMDRFPTSHARDDVRLPTVIAIFGANASGKSTILRAITSTINFMCHSVDWPIDSNILGFNSFMSADAWQKPTKITCQFDALWFGDAPSLYRYELTFGPKVSKDISYERGHVQYEALFSSRGKEPEKGRRRSWQRIFERNEEATIKFGEGLGIRSNDDRVAAIRANASVISTLAKLNVAWAQTIFRELQMLQSNFWGLNRSKILSADYQATMWKYYDDNPEVLERLNREITRFDTGITQIKIDKSNSEFLLPFFYHQGLDLPILFEEESSGTQHIVAMFPQIFYVLAIGATAIIDEFDCDLHPALVPELFSWFQNPETNPHKAQLIITAHNTQILRDLEKEEVFFTEKTMDGATNIYGAKDIEGLRREPNLANTYISGVLGAMPRIG